MNVRLSVYLYSYIIRFFGQMVGGACLPRQPVCPTQDIQVFPRICALSIIGCDYVNNTKHGGCKYKM